MLLLDLIRHHTYQKYDRKRNAKDSTFSTLQIKTVSFTLPFTIY